MYNPYLEEQFIPLEEGPPPISPPEESPAPSFVDVMSQFMPNDTGKVGDLESLEGKLGALSSLGKLKDLVKVEHLSLLGDLFGGKKAKAEKNQGNPSYTAEGDSQATIGNTSSWKEKLHLEDINTGDVLLVIIVIYLMLEGDDKIELAITLGILAFFWWNDGKKKELLASSSEELG